eukprot:CAMPEP_0184687370 /NCGR_PEP_ID=MMETSP0312-20130426/26084_1 /TAXON_ID=31354 /ORGANISM="Compsopogon coeruleus, Strain SAG 36.94" /LENGTH=97 /DNA_ID=CAMNT_0027143415 /DNA_START=108 /DNA_END=401 /DNA_ORIENTATION=-
MMDGIGNSDHIGYPGPVGRGLIPPQAENKVTRCQKYRAPINTAVSLHGHHAQEGDDPSLLHAHPTLWKCCPGERPSMSRLRRVGGPCPDGPLIPYIS